jgi:hypothetical protein
LKTTSFTLLLGENTFNAGVAGRIIRQFAVKAGHGQAKGRLKRVKLVDSYGLLIAVPLHAKLTLRSDRPENEVVLAQIGGGAVIATPG